MIFVNKYLLYLSLIWKNFLKKNNISYSDSKPVRTIPSSSNQQINIPNENDDVSPIIVDGKVVGFHYICKCGEKTEFNFQLDN